MLQQNSHFGSFDTKKIIKYTNENGYKFTDENGN
jgi:hypothetical protein